mmetsp:Transcript_21161/g.24520  ORF Transcript_21161/g.24520 Transcript_21161/m.24520 type:complete len:113 (-) Transcript_21161:108-446(-)
MSGKFVGDSYNIPTPSSNRPRKRHKRSISNDDDDDATKQQKITSKDMARMGDHIGLLAVENLNDQLIKLLENKYTLVDKLLEVDEGLETDGNKRKFLRRKELHEKQITKLDG